MTLLRNHAIALVAALVFSAETRAEPFPPQSGEFLTVEENKLLLGGLPDLVTLTPVTPAQANTFFSALKSEKIEYRYIVGSCEDRAHYIAMLALKGGLSVAKIWAIAPARYTLLSRELITVVDPYHVVSKVNWGHHVTSVILIDNGSSDPDAMVIDLSISPNAPIPLRDWMRSLGNVRAKFFFTGAGDYLFNSLNGLTIYDNVSAQPESPVKMPAWMPNILTGDFQKYSPMASNDRIAEGMAINDIAMEIYDRRLPVSTSDQLILREAIKTENALMALLVSSSSSGISTNGLAIVKSRHSARKSHWLKRLVSIQP